MGSDEGTDSKLRNSAYTGRESVSTRNPHAAVKPAMSQKELARLSPEERVLAQWKSSSGSPISDEAKAQFRITCLGKTFNLADVRLWQSHYAQGKDGKGIIFLEFFFDGSPDELGEQQEARRLVVGAFENMMVAFRSSSAAAVLGAVAFQAVSILLPRAASASWGWTLTVPAGGKFA
ncbi:unnamed protein product [Polarella glacialis]|uniref:Uncharacterized protein n=1 Tax=Polarella glacialis TaxID=89957 RepID=A0A813E0X5_POLGL|nr:unnamed protein product [Polarella glacialis]